MKNTVQRFTIDSIHCTAFVENDQIEIFGIGGEPKVMKQLKSAIKFLLADPIARSAKTELGHLVETIR
tara:strand:+ start:406 stop:609 length:204 start_codon:yes stop_codon:yes gene_type:complete